MRKTVYGWLIFLTGFGTSVLLDYLVRMSDGNIRTGELHPVLFFSIYGISGLIAVWFLYQGTRSIQRLWLRIVLIVVQVAIGYVLSAALGLLYVVYSGIDAL